MACWQVCCKVKPGQGGPQLRLWEVMCSALPAMAHQKLLLVQQQPYVLLLGQAKSPGLTAQVSETIKTRLCHAYRAPSDQHVISAGMPRWSGGLGRSTAPAPSMCTPPAWPTRAGTLASGLTGMPLRWVQQVSVGQGMVSYSALCVGGRVMDFWC